MLNIQPIKQKAVSIMSIMNKNPYNSNIVLSVNLFSRFNISNLSSLARIQDSTNILHTKVIIHNDIQILIISGTIMLQLY